jgi:hypothetical protein
MDGREPGRYAWLAGDGLEYEVAARVADATHRLGQLRLAQGDPDGAMDAARAGLRLAFDDELLWRDLLTAAHATGQEHLLRAAVAEVCARTALDEVLPRSSTSCCPRGDRRSADQLSLPAPYCCFSLASDFSQPAGGYCSVSGGGLL